MSDVGGSRRDPILEHIKATQPIYYKVIGFEGPGEWPENTVAARIAGPGLPARGLPFCVPAKDAHIWADRIALVLNQALAHGVKSGIRQRQVEESQAPAGGNA